MTTNRINSSVMPISKIPVVHKFGIISLSQAEQIIRQQRLNEHSLKRKKIINKSTSCPLITVDFITKYNSCSESDKEHLNGVVKRVLEHAKYKSCLNKLSTPVTSTSKDDKSKYGGDLLDVSEGWLELIMLCQCCGPFQEESLLCLASSLSFSPLSLSHIPALFYMSGLCYHWLKSEISSSPVLRSGELLLLKVLHKVSLRLYQHHLTGNLQDLCSKVEVRQLKFDMEGFECRERTYRNFPEALLYWKVAMEVGTLICEKYGDQQQSVTPVLSIPDEETNDTHTDDLTNQTQSSTPGSHGGHSLSPILWHALDVWQCNQQGCSSLPEAIQDLVTCSIDFNTEQWLEGLLAMDVLCNAAKLSRNILLLVQSLAAGTTKNMNTLIPEKQISRNKKDKMTTQPSLSHYKEDELTTTGSDGMSEFHLNGSGVVNMELFSQGKTVQARGVTTLNVLGMQPTFVEPPDSEYYTGMEDNYNEEEEEEDEEEEEEEDGSSRSGRFSVTTQALIDTESIPDTPLSTHSTEDNSTPCFSTLDSLDLSTFKVSSTTDANFIVSGRFESQQVSIVKGSSTIHAENDSMDNVGLAISGGTTNSHEKQIEGEGKALQKRVTLGFAVNLPVTPDASVTPSDIDKSDIVSNSSIHESIDRIGLLDDRFEFIKHKKHETGPKSVTLSLPPARRPDSRCTHYTHSTAPTSRVGGGVLGSQVPPSTLYQQSILSLSQSIGSDFTSTDASAQNGINCFFNTWPMEIQLAYILNMADIVMYGCDSSIQKMALQGPDEDRTTGQYGIVNLTGYNGSLESKNTSESWFVRHCVILGLSRICHTCRDLPIQDGFSGVAWSVLQQRFSLESEQRVLQAYKLEQACPSTSIPSSKTNRAPSPRPSTPTSYTSQPSLIACMAEQLADLYLPAIDLDIPSSTKKIAIKPPMVIKGHGVISTKNIKPKVVTRYSTTDKPPTKPETYISKTNRTLHEIAERHWLVQMKEEDEEEKIRYEEEEKQTQKEYEMKIKIKTQKLSRQMKPIQDTL